MKHIKNKVFDYLKHYSNREIKADRYEMARFFGVSEREIRSTIESLRNDGYRVCSSSTTGGYWIAESEAEYQRFRGEYISRAKKTFSTASAMDKGPISGQTIMEV